MALFLAILLCGEPRTWTDASGKFSVEAEYVGTHGQQVTLQKADGSRLTIPLEKLSGADRKWLATTKQSAEDQKAVQTPPKPFGEQLRDKAIAQTEEQLAKVRERERDARKHRKMDDLVSARRARASLEETLKTLKDRGKPYRPALDEFSLKVGDIGVLGSVAAVQVVGPYDALVEGRKVEFIPPSVLGASGGSKRLARSKPFWITGYPTDGIADGESFNPGKFFEVTGTKQYTTAMGGSNTVFVLQLVPSD